MSHDGLNSFVAYSEVQEVLELKNNFCIINIRHNKLLFMRNLPDKYVKIKISDVVKLIEIKFRFLLRNLNIDHPRGEILFVQMIQNY